MQFNFKTFKRKFSYDFFADNFVNNLTTSHLDFLLDSAPQRLERRVPFLTFIGFVHWLLSLLLSEFFDARTILEHENSLNDGKIEVWINSIS